MSYKLRVFVILLMFMGLLGNVTILHADIFKIDEFQIMKDGSLFFDDTFSDGLAPPGAPNLSNGNQVLYNVKGTMGPETDGKLTLDTSKGEKSLNIDETRYNLVNSAVLKTRSTTGSDPGLDKGSTFSVIGIYNLALPSQRNMNYDIRLTDATKDSEGDDILALEVFRNSAGTGFIRFRHLNDIANSVAILGDKPLELNHAQIALKLSTVDSNTNMIRASYAYIDDGTIGDYKNVGDDTGI